MKDLNGKVYLIGAGPGDPGLLTIKAMECIKTADVVIYDYLAAPSLLNYAKNNAEIIYVGKKGGDHTLPQDKINDLIAQKASQGLMVARLKGGDPFIFGRGGEEAEILIDLGIDFEVVPGVTSAIAAPAYAGIPLTHREHTSSVSLITGHENPLKEKSSINWSCFANSGSTLVFLMGVKNLPNITSNLMAHGKPSNTPVALVRWGTTAMQRTVSGTLDNIVARVKEAKLKSPAVIVVGSVVNLREKMKWFELRPLLGKSIVVTRARNQASDLVNKLESLGARCIQIPTIDIVPPADMSPLVHAINNIKNFDWLVFTSVNGVKFFFDTLFDQKMDVRILGNLKFACIGPATKEKLLGYGIVSDILPETYRAESVVKSFEDVDIKDKKILLPRAMEARTVLPTELTKLGAVVEEVCAYETIKVSDQGLNLVQLLEDGDIDMVTFTSSSTVKNFMDLISPDKFEKLTNNVSFASIGPITSDTAVSLGVTPNVTAKEYTIPGLIDSITEHFKGSL